MKNLEIGHEIVFMQPLAEIPPDPPLLKGGREKIAKRPPHLPSPVTPRREEGKYIETAEEIPSPLMGEG